MSPCLRDSDPSVALTVTTSDFWRLTGSEPALNAVARSLASCSGKPPWPPVISPEPMIWFWIVGAEMTPWSTMIASCLPLSAWVTWLKTLVPSGVSLKVRNQPPPRDPAVSGCARADPIMLPVTRTGPSSYLVCPSLSSYLEVWIFPSI